MTFAGQETSQESGRPVELYTFSLALSIYRFTSAEDDQIVGGETFEHITIKRGGVKQGQETRQSGMTIEMPGNHDLPSRYVLAVPSERASVLIQRFHRGDGNLATFFEGRVKSVAFSKDGRVASIAVEPAITATARQIPVFTFGASCENVLGDGFGVGATGLCDVNLDDAAYRHTATVTAQTSLTITVPGAAAFGDGWFNGGTIETTAGLDARLILTQVGDVLTLHIGFPFPMVGQAVILRAGCDRSPNTCSAKFNKFDRFQAYAFVPTRNPFDGLDPEIC